MTTIKTPKLWDKTKYTNNSNLGMSTAVWLAADEYDFNPTFERFSATQLLKSTKSIILSTRFGMQAGENQTDITDMVPSRMGTALHWSIEQTWTQDDLRNSSMRALGVPEHIIDGIRINPEEPELGTYPVYVEIRGYKEIEGVTISGSPDIIINGQVQDFKSTKTYNWIHGGNDDKYCWQGSIYRWIFPDKITQPTMQVNFIFTDWNPNKYVADKANYPPYRVGERELKLKPIDTVEDFLRNKVREIKQYQDADEADMPPCTPEDVWQKPTVYAYYKNPTSTGRSTANFSSHADAIARKKKDGDVGRIDIRPGKVGFCVYCPGRAICKQAETYEMQGLL